MQVKVYVPRLIEVPSEYLPAHVRFCSSAFDGPTDIGQMQRWMDFSDKAGLLMYGSSYPHWSTSAPDMVAAGLENSQREKVLWQNAAELYGLGAAVDEGSMS